MIPLHTKETPLSKLLEEFDDKIVAKIIFEKKFDSVNSGDLRIAVEEIKSFIAQAYAQGRSSMKRDIEAVKEAQEKVDVDGGIPFLRGLMMIGKLAYSRRGVKDF